MPLTERALSLLYRLLAGRSESFDHAGGTLTLRHVGPSAPGPRWLLLHGLANTSIAWLPISVALRRQRPLTLPELTSLGGSRCPDGALDVQQATTALGEWLDRGQGDRPGRVLLVGISLGGWVAARLAAQRPEQVAGLVLVNAAGYRDQDWQRIQQLIDIQAADQTPALTEALFLRRRALLRLLRPALYRVFTQPSVKGVLSRLREEHALSDEFLASIRVPTLLLWGAQDGLFPLAVGHRMAAAIPGASLQVLSGAAHAVTWERPRAVTRAIQEFADRLPQQVLR